MHGWPLPQCPGACQATNQFPLQPRNNLINAWWLLHDDHDRLAKPSTCAHRGMPHSSVDSLQPLNTHASPPAGVCLMWPPTVCRCLLSWGTSPTRSSGILVSSLLCGTSRGQSKLAPAFPW
jgi:hypothetical protein